MICIFKALASHYFRQDVQSSKVNLFFQKIVFSWCYLFYHRQYLINRPVTTFHFHEITTQDVMCIISKLPNKKSTGYDEISTETIKILSAVISPTLSLIINKCILNGTVPDEMKVSKIKPLFKKGDVTLLNNYRPISLLP